MKFWWLSSERMTVGVTTRDGIIVAGAPIVRGFVGRPLSRLVAWMQGHEGFRMREIK